jgi:very-short-patch-repair endonuclease
MREPKSKEAILGKTKKPEDHPGWCQWFFEGHFGHELMNIHSQFDTETAVVMMQEFLKLYEKCESPIETPMAFLLAMAIALEGAEVWAQAPIGPYRVDFLVKKHTYAEPSLIIECEQAARDKRRDRDLTLKGYTVIRFTGHEIAHFDTGLFKHFWAAVRSPTRSVAA